MDKPRSPQTRSTSLPLLILTFIAGIALGWLLHDTLRNSTAQEATLPPAALPTAVAAPSSGAEPGAVLPPTQTAAPTQAPRPTRTLDATAEADAERPTAPVPIVPSIPAPVDTPLAPEPTSVPPTLAPTEPPTGRIAGYAGHIVAEGETLDTIAARGGSTPDVIASYNRLAGPPAPGRALIVPRLEGHPADLESAPILVQRGRRDRPWVALTLDAGASAEPVPDMLKTLRDHHITITFFLTGKWIAENPDLTRQILADGHEIANHTQSHPDLRNLDDASIRKELADTEAIMQQTAGGSTRPLFRPPFGAYDERVLRIVEEEGYLPVYWTLDSLDSVGEPKTPEFLLERVTAKLTPEQLRGAIILAHCGSAPTAEALPQILDRFAEMGFEVKKVSEVLGS